MQFNGNIVKLYSRNIKYSSHSHSLKKAVYNYIKTCFKKLKTINVGYLGIFNKYLPHSAEICARYAQFCQFN